ncbi:MAG: hypothetical protein M0Q26_05905 [Chitinophagaceae bacterium]|nr:hypothetical protein [Chitinophagaceae bacterium]MDP1763417.1 hypothetical protein [Sediminibacterium sp.]
MSTRVTERPSPLSFSKNDIRYAFFTDNLTPQGLYLQVELYSRITKGSIFINWTCNQFVDPYIDANLFILVNEVNKVIEFANNTGSLAVNAGDIVRVILPIFDSWPATGSPYAKLIIKEDATELFKNFSIDVTEPGWLTYTFIAAAGKTYTVVAYTSTEAALAHTADLAVAVINTYTLQKTFNLKPNGDGKTYLYLSERIDSLLKYILPNTAYVVKDASEQSAELYIRYRQVTKADPNPVWNETETAHVRRVLKGGIEKQMASRNNYFTYQATNKSFFTWMPNNRFVFSDEMVFLSIYLTGAGFKIHTNVMRIDGVEASEDTAIDLSQGVFFHLNVSPGILNIAGIAAAYPVRYYEVSILNAANEVIYNAVRFYIEFRPNYASYDLLYHNSLGAAESIRVKGDITWSIERDVQESEGTMDVNDGSATQKNGETADNSITKKDIYKGDIGFLRTADGKMKRLQEALVDILISQSIYHYIDGRWVRARIIQRSVDLRAGSDKKLSFPIEWMLPFNNPVLTPKDISLGIATDTEIYY